LIGLAVASQIPCSYCVYFHTVSAKATGATDEEIKEAVAQGAMVRHWSMVINGAQIDLEEFKKEFQGMLEYMAEKSKTQ
jgi:AhpD family alkylhydroperoxidase